MLRCSFYFFIKTLVTTVTVFGTVGTVRNVTFIEIIEKNTLKHYIKRLHKKGILVPKHKKI